MAAPNNVNVTGTGMPGSDVAALVTQVNNLTASLRLLTAKLDADAGVTDTTYNSLITDGAIATAPALLSKTFG